MSSQSPPGPSPRSKEGDQMEGGVQVKVSFRMFVLKGKLMGEAPFLCERCPCEGRDK